MSNYLLIESRDPFEAADVEHDYALAAGLAAKGNGVTLFLVSNGVLPARPCAHSDRLTELSQQSVTVLADSFSLRERGIDPAGLTSGVAAGELDLVVDAMVDGAQTMWL
jgi:hypothetical protein